MPLVAEEPRLVNACESVKVTVPVVMTVTLGVVSASAPMLPPLVEVRMTEVVPVIVPVPPIVLLAESATVGPERLPLIITPPDEAVKLAVLVTAIGLLIVIAPAAFEESVSVRRLAEELPFIVTACESVMDALPVVLKVRVGVFKATGP